MEFPPISGLDLTTLRWLRSGDRPLEFRLSAGDVPVVQMRWEREASSTATAMSGAGTWTLHRGGFLNPHIVARTAGAAEPIGRLSVHLQHHSIEIPGGATYRFRRAGILLPAWTVSDASGQQVLHIEPVREGRQLAGGAVVAAATAGGLPEFRLLLSLSWYFIALAWFEDEALVPFEDRDVGP
jgi:hypothetical protein